MNQAVSGLGQQLFRHAILLFLLLAPTLLIYADYGNKTFSRHKRMDPFVIFLHLGLNDKHRIFGCPSRNFNPHQPQNRTKNRSTEIR